MAESIATESLGPKLLFSSRPSYKNSTPHAMLRKHVSDGENLFEQRELLHYTFFAAINGRRSKKWVLHPLRV